MSHPDAEPRRRDGAVASYGPTTAREALAGHPPRADFGRDFADPGPTPPASEARNASAILDALGYTADRLDRVEHQLGDLNGVLMRLGHNLAPVLTEGRYNDPPGLLDPEPEDVHVDRRSTIARNITGLGRRADKLGDIVGWLRQAVEAIDDALELEGVDR